MWPTLEFMVFATILGLAARTGACDFEPRSQGSQALQSRPGPVGLHSSSWPQSPRLATLAANAVKMRRRLVTLEVRS
jgi:hypothetical protein